MPTNNMIPVNPIITMTSINEIFPVTIIVITLTSTIAFPVHTTSSPFTRMTPPVAT